ATRRTWAAPIRPVADREGFRRGVERHAARRSVRAHSRYDAGRRTRLAEAGGGRRRDRVHAEQRRLPRRADGAAERRGGAQATEVRRAGSGEVIHYRGNISVWRS